MTPASHTPALKESLKKNFSYSHRCKPHPQPQPCPCEGGRSPRGLQREASVCRGRAGGCCLLSARLSPAPAADPEPHARTARTAPALGERHQHPSSLCASVPLAPAFLRGFNTPRPTSVPRKGGMVSLPALHGAASPLGARPLHHSLEKKEAPEGTSRSLQLPVRSLRPGQSWVLLPGNKGEDEEKRPQEVPGEV